MCKVVAALVHDEKNIYIIYLTTTAECKVVHAVTEKGNSGENHTPQTAPAGLQLFG